jgi:hypothetical protein
VNALDRKFILKYDLQVIYNMLLHDAGITAAGWVKAADALNVRPAAPSWITRHKNKNSGVYKFKATATDLFIQAKNPSKHPKSQYIQKILDRAFSKRADKLKAQVLAAIAKGKVDRATIDWGRAI